MGRFVLMSPENLRGQVLPVAGDRVVVGRGESSDLRIEDARVSTAHAVLTRAADKILLEDLASTNGTLVNGRTLAQPRPLRHGDIVQFGAVQARYEEAAARSDTMLALPIAASAAGNLDIQQQSAAQLNNVGGNQYIQQVRQQQSFMREIAAARTRAGRLITVGFVLFVLGIAVYIGVWLRMAGELQRAMDESTAAWQNGKFALSEPTQVLGPTIGGIPIGALGLAVGSIGFLILVVGIVLHVVATSRRRRMQEQRIRTW